MFYHSFKLLNQLRFFNFKKKKEIEKKRRLGKLKNRQQGARTIRFEMPFHVRCTNCKNMIAKGVRFNAEKKKGKLLFIKHKISWEISWNYYLYVYYAMYEMQEFNNH